ncbi:hypothetical protein NM688_g8525 [Phlebia brevispora]|uniref:Uncharacterized protein n=1 Tax=Phlebia brevispora TaxID=194682 RepID=A0ACC1RT69_9APHY|nr:hypothetical protein NM688_g8525 [Phlebia brevispora]
MKGAILSISGPSHPAMAILDGGRTQIGGPHIRRMKRSRYASQDFLTADSILCVKSEGLNAARCFAERSSGSVETQFTVVPHLNGANIPEQEYMFVIDRSASMLGRHIETANSAMVLLLRALPVSGTILNIFSFGTQCDSLWQEGRRYDQQSLHDPTAYTDAMSADYGGTEICAALDTVFATRCVSLPTSCFVLTNGDAYDIINGAPTGRDDTPQPSAHTQGPSFLPALYSGCRFVVFALVRSERFFIPQQVTLKAKHPRSGEVVKTPVEVELLEPSWTAVPRRSPVHTLAARRIIMYLEDKIAASVADLEDEVVRLGVPYQLFQRLMRPRPSYLDNLSEDEVSEYCTIRTPRASLPSLSALRSPRAETEAVLPPKPSAVPLTTSTRWSVSFATRVRNSITNSNSSNALTTAKSQRNSVKGTKLDGDRSIKADFLVSNLDPRRWYLGKLFRARSRTALGSEQRTTPGGHRAKVSSQPAGLYAVVSLTGLRESESVAVRCHWLRARLRNPRSPFGASSIHWHYECQGCSMPLKLLAPSESRREPVKAAIFDTYTLPPSVCLPHSL